MQFARGESVDSRQRLLLPVKAHGSHLQSDERGGGSEEDVQLLAEHRTPLITPRYVSASVSSTGNSAQNRKACQIFIL
jgi:hypothetical protein